MAIEQTPGGTVFTGAHIHLRNEAALVAALALEVNTGMRHSRGSTMVRANALSERLDLPAMRADGHDVPAGRLGMCRTKKGALADVTVYMLAVWGWKPSDSVRRALGEKVTAQCERKAARIVKAAQKMTAS